MGAARGRALLIPIVTAAPLAALLCAGPALASDPTGPMEPSDHGDSYYSYCLSRQAWLRQDFAEALEYLKKAADSDPSSAELAVDLARLHLDLGQSSEAAAAANRAVELAPTAGPSWRVLADALFMEAMKDSAPPDAIGKAYDAYRKVLTMDPTDSEALLNLSRLQIARGELADALASLEKHLELTPSSEEGVFTAAQVLIKLNRAPEAVGLLEAALQRNPFNAQLGMALVDAHEAEGDLDAAMDAAQALTRMRADPIRVQFVLARLSQKRGKPNETFIHLEEMARLMDLRPSEFAEGDRAEVRLRMVLALVDAGRVQDALSQADKGAAIFPADPRFVLRKGEALLVADRDGDAETVFKNGLKLAPAPKNTFPQQISDTYLSAAARKERGGAIDRAEQLLKKSIEWNGKNAGALNYLGYMLAERGTRLDEAIGYIRRALDGDPSNGAYLDSLGWALYQKKEYPEAEKALVQARSAMAEEPAIHEHLGDLYLATGRRDEALKAWKKALDLGAENAADIRKRIERNEDGPSTAP